MPELELLNNIPVERDDESRRSHSISTEHYKDGTQPVECQESQDFSEKKFDDVLHGGSYNNIILEEEEDSLAAKSCEVSDSHIVVNRHRFENELAAVKLNAGDQSIHMSND